MVALAAARRRLRALGMDAVASEARHLHGELRAGRHPQLPGAVRASLGLAATAGDIDRLITALGEIAAHGPRARYVHVPEHDEYRPLETTAAA